MISKKLKHRWQARCREWMGRFLLFFVLGGIMAIQVIIAAQVLSEDVRNALDPLAMGLSFHEALLALLILWVVFPFIRVGLYTAYWYYKHGTLKGPDGETA